jgi:teichoic acid transport system permease protein
VLLSWLVSAGWAVVLLAVGLVVFWRGEGGYGRG